MALSVAVKKMILGILVSALVIGIGGAVVYTVFFPPFPALGFVLGLAMTTLLNIVKVVMLERTVTKATAMNVDESASATRLLGVQYLIRFVLTGLVLVAAATLDFIDLWGAFAGIFTFLVAAHSLRFTLPKDE